MTDPARLQYRTTEPLPSADNSVNNTQNIFPDETQDISDDLIDLEPQRASTPKAPTNTVNLERVNQLILQHTKNQRVAKMEDLTKQLGAMKLTTDDDHQLQYLQQNEQLSKLQTLEIAENRNRAEQIEEIRKALQLFVDDDKDAAKEYIKTLQKDKDAFIQKTERIKSSVTQATKVANKYKTTFTKPTITKAPDTYQPNPQRTSAREIISVTGKFDPRNDRSDFSQVWNKLTSYGKLNYFDETDYIQALMYVLEGDAYEALLSMSEDDHSLSYIMNYFSQVYGRKRSINSDRAAVDNFTRHKGEPLDRCMARSMIAIDRLKHLHPSEAWPEVRNIMRRNILTQVISDKTKRYITIEENKILETTGLRVQVDKLVEMAQDYETLYNEAPNREVQTVFKAASGGFTENIESMRQELQHFKKSKFDQKNQITEVVQDILTNPARLYKNENKPIEQRDRRREGMLQNQRAARQNSYDRGRNLSNERPPTPTSVTYKRPENPKLPPSLQRSRDQPYKSRSPSPYVPPKLVDKPPFTFGRNEAKNNPRSPSYDRQRNRNYSQDRSQPYRQSRPTDRNKTNNYRYNNSRSNSRGYYDQRQSIYQRDRSYSRDRTRSPSATRYRPDSIQRYRNRSNERPYSEPRPRSQYQQQPPSFHKSVLLHINKADTENSHDTSYN